MHKVNFQDSFKIGLDTERWFEYVISTQSNAIKLKHQPTDSYDFVGDFGGKLFLLDVKFLKERYRVEGFFEIAADRKWTGIYDATKRVQPQVRVLSAILHCGEYFIIDVKKLREAVESGQLRVREKVNCEGCHINYVVMNGFDDPRFLVARGPMSAELWRGMKKSSSLKKMDIDAWMLGEYKEVA